MVGKKPVQQAGGATVLGGVKDRIPQTVLPPAARAKPSFPRGGGNLEAGSGFGGGSSGGGGGGGGEGEAIAEENQRRIASMTSSDRAELQDEVTRILSPESIAFLRKRAAARVAGLGNPDTAVAGSSGGGGGDSSSSSSSSGQHVSPRLPGPMGGLATSAAVGGRDPVPPAGAVPVGLAAPGGFKPRPEWLNMDVQENDKLEWTGTLPTVEEGRKTEMSKFKGHQVCRQT
jgi:hypothetical protein